MAVMQHDKDERQLYKVTDASLPFSPSSPSGPVLCPNLRTLATVARIFQGLYNVHRSDGSTPDK